MLFVVLAIAVVSAVGTVASVAVGLYNLSEQVKEKNRVAAAVERATAGREGEDWTLNELFSYLEAKGTVSAMEVVDRDSPPPEWIFKTADNRTVRVRRLDDDAIAANDAKGSMKSGFSWGRFSFAGDPEANERFRRFLHK